MGYKIFIEKQGKPYPYTYNVENQDGSLNPDPKVSTKIKPLDRESGNAEVEKSEIILDPETGALHKALGKPHSKGGTPVLLKDNSFIFSNYKGLAINKKEKELFEFKLGGRKIRNNTPSKVLEKEVDTEHHNKMIDILGNEKQNSKESVNSAKLMMLKNLEKAGQVAFLQESKKGEQIPTFAQSTAPIYSKDTDEQITQSMQYLQMGGYNSDEDKLNYELRMMKTNQKPAIFAQPFFTPSQQINNIDTSALPSYQTGGRKLTDKEIQQAELNPLIDVNGWRFVWRNGRKVYYDKPDSNTQRQKPSEGDTNKFNNWFSKQTPQFQADYIQRSKKVMQAPNQFGYKNTPPQYGYTKDSTEANLLRRQFPQMDSMTMLPQQQFHQPSIAQQGNKPGNPTGIVDPKTYNTKLTPWQLLNMGIPFYKALTVKTQYPLRQHQESVIPQMENMNVQPQLNTINQGYFNAANLTRTMNPTQGSAFAQQLYGNRIDNSNQAIGNTQQFNIGIQNKQKELAANILNQDSSQNRAFDKQYYDQTQIATKNASDLREAYFNQGMNISNDTISKKLAFDSFLNSQQQYKGKKTYIDKDGTQHYQGKALYEPQTGFFGNSVKYSSPEIDWSTYVSSQTSMEDDDTAYVRNIRELLPGISEDKIGDLLRERTKKKSLAAYSAANIQNQITPSFKGGGKFRFKK